MKKLTTLLSLIFLMIHSKGQNIENPSFDSVYIGGIDRIYEWITSDAWPTGSGDTVQPLTPNAHFVSSGLQYHETLFSVQIDYTTAYDGPLAVKLLTDSDRVKNDGNAFSGFVVNGNHFYTDSTGYIDFSKCGTPFPYRPYSLKGHYKFEDNSPSLHNYPHAIVLLKKYNSITQTSDKVGFSEIYIQFFATSTWRAFEMPINYFSNDVPDSIVVAFISSGARFPATFWVDSIGFDYNFPSDIIENPTNEKLFRLDSKNHVIYFTENKLIQSATLFDINGKLVIHESFPLTQFDVSALPKGNYILSFGLRSNGRKTFKINLQ